MIQESRDMSLYDVLDVRKNATPEGIREAYVRAKNAFANDSLATYSLFDKSQSRKMLEEIENAYNVLADPDKRRRYDQAHGFIRSSEELRNLPNVMIENGEEISEIGMGEVKNFESREYAPAPSASIHSIQSMDRSKSERQLENIFFSDDANASARANPTPKVIAQESNQKNFAERFVANNSANGQNKDSEPLSKNFIPNASMNPNAHYIHKRHGSDAEIEEVLKQAEAVDGSFLRKAREYRGVAIEEMMEFTKLTRKYLEALEHDSVDKLPAPVYVRGFVMQYAKALQLEASRVTASYMRNYQSLREARGIR